MSRVHDSRNYDDRDGDYNEDETVNSEPDTNDYPDSGLPVPRGSVLDQYPFLKIQRDMPDTDADYDDAINATSNNNDSRSIYTKPPIEYTTYLANSRPTSHYKDTLNQIIKTDTKLPSINQLRKPIRFNNNLKNANSWYKLSNGASNVSNVSNRTYKPKKETTNKENSEEKVVHHHHYYSYGDKQLATSTSILPATDYAYYTSPVEASNLNYFSPRVSPSYYTSAASPMYYTTAMAPSTYYGDQKYKTSINYETGLSTKVLPSVNFGDNYPNYFLPRVSGSYYYSDMNRFNNGFRSNRNAQLFRGSNARKK